MNQERIKAAAWEISAVDYPNYEPDPELAAKVLAAADAVMFSDEAVELAAAELSARFASSGWDDMGPITKQSYREAVQIIIAALKGGHA